MRKIIIDTDPGIDDSLAILFAVASGRFEVLGLTTVFGNISVDIATINALRLTALMERTDIPVARGAADPLNGKFKGGVPFIHGDDGQGNTNKAPSSNKEIATPASEFIVEQLRRFPGEVAIAALGPLTNLALALEQDPGIQELASEVVFMGGNAFCPGNATPAAEANMFSDPEAADLVMGARWPVTMIGLDVTHKTLLQTEDFDEIAENTSPIHQHIAAAYRFYLDFFRRVNKIEGTYLHDSSVFAYLIDKSLYSTESYPIRVAMEGISKGKTWPALGDSDQEGREALRPWKNRPRINVAIDVKGKEVIGLLKTVLNKKP